MSTKAPAKLLYGMARMNPGDPEPEWLTRPELLLEVGPLSRDPAHARGWRRESQVYRYRAAHPELKGLKVLPLER